MFNELQTIVKRYDKCKSTGILAWWVSSFLTAHQHRPDELENMSLHDFLSQYKREVAGSRNQMKLKTLGYFLRKKNTFTQESGGITI